jgi:hypothetical protein
MTRSPEFTTEATESTETLFPLCALCALCVKFRVILSVGPSGQWQLTNVAIHISPYFVAVSIYG